MSLSHEHVGLKILAKIKINTLTRAELLFPLCYEIPCNREKERFFLHISALAFKNGLKAILLGYLTNQSPLYFDSTTF